MRRIDVAVVCAVLLAGAGEAEAGADADVKKAFGAFVDGVVAGKPLPPGLELFVTPFEDDKLPENLSYLRAMLKAPKVKVLQVVVSPGGTSAWVAAEIPATVAVAGKKRRADTIRATAFLAHDGAAWIVRSAHWSIAVKNAKPESCGMLSYEWEVEPDVPAALLPAVRNVLELLDKDDPASFLGLLSADKRALVFGSAPKETFAGAAKIQSVFEKWSVSLPYWDREETALPAAAGVGPDGELAWMAAGVAYFRLCTSYRTTFVLAQEQGAWKIVHQHYSEPIQVD